LLFVLAFGSSALAQATFNSATLAFGNHVINVPSGVKKAWLTNTQTVPITISTIAISGGNAPGDYVLDGGGDCPLSPKTLGAGDKCNIPVTFTPSALGSRTATLTVTDDASNSPQTVALTRTGTSPVTLSVSSLYLGTVRAGNTSAAKSVTLTNDQGVALAFSSIVTSGDFAIASNTCGMEIAAGAKCTVGVTFSPTATGTRAGALTLTDNAANSPQTVTLTGTGSSPVTVSPASLTLANTTVGTVSVAKTVTLTNHLTTSLTFSTPVASGDFAVASNTCATVGPGLTCTVGVTFAPMEVGPLTGALTIPYSSFGSPSVVTLSGTGNTIELLSIAVTPANAAILPGQTQQFAATGHYRGDSTHDLTAWATWTSSAPGMATINAAGLASAVAFGPTTIEAALGAINGSTTLTVWDGGSFANTGSLVAVRQNQTATLLNDGTALIVGGDNWDVSGNFPYNAELYNFSTGTFSDTVGGLNTARRQHTATLLNNGMALVAGGFNDWDQFLSSAELYNPATGTFSYTPGSLNTAREDHTATLLNDGTVLMAGGDNASGALASAELYNPATGTFTYTVGSLNTARAWHTATLLNNGLVLMAGGQDSSGNPLASAELYNPSTETFSYTTGNLNTARYYDTATLLNNGTVLMAGGTNLSYTAFASAELYNPATGTFSYTTGSLNTARAMYTATLLNNGLVLIAGGKQYNIELDYYPDLASAELYVPATETFIPTANMNYTRNLDTATLLNNGQVLMAGGWWDYIAELYLPATLTPSNLQSIAVTPGTSTLSPGATQQFIATGTFSDGSTQQLPSVTWSTSNSNVAQITNDATNHGVGLAIAGGTVTITATAGSVSGTATLTVQ
jgi:hypothetical protein